MFIRRYFSIVLHMCNEIFFFFLLTRESNQFIRLRERWQRRAAPDINPNYRRMHERLIGFSYLVYTYNESYFASALCNGFAVYLVSQVCAAIRLLHMRSLSCVYEVIIYASVDAYIFRSTPLWQQGCNL